MAEGVKYYRMSDYIDYVGVFSLSILAVSGSYLLDFSKYAAVLVLLLIPTSLGFTAYISRDGFNRASLSSLISLFLVGFNPLVSFVAGIVAVSNPLVSVFAGGESFKDFFNSVALPLLLTGLIVGSAVFAFSYYQPSIQETVEEAAVDAAVGQMEFVLDRTSIFSSTKSRQAEMVKNVSRNSVLLTRQIVMQNMTGELSRQEYRSLRKSFDYAQTSVPEKFDLSRKNSSSAGEVVSEQLRSTIRGLIDGRTMIAVIPVLGLTFYSLSPFVGLIAALSGVFWRETLSRAKT